jgi:hypothetical protein
MFVETKVVVDENKVENWKMDFIQLRIYAVAKLNRLIKVGRLKFCYVFNVGLFEFMCKSRLMKIEQLISDDLGFHLLRAI